MIEIKEAVIVEGKYDKQRLKNILNSTIIETNGFRIFKDKNKVNLIKQLSEKQGIVILTDSDGAGFVIRNHLKGIIPNKNIKNAYIPKIKGKERRKDKPSKEGTLGVEGIGENLLMQSLMNAKVTIINKAENNITKEQITKLDLYKLGIVGRENSKKLRIQLLKKLNLPEYITTNALLEVLNNIITIEELVSIIEN